MSILVMTYNSGRECNPRLEYDITIERGYIPGQRGAWYEPALAHRWARHRNMMMVCCIIIINNNIISML